MNGGQRPNVLWIMCDELRADALSCYGNVQPAISTPNIDALTADGVLFERSYTASPVCVPARTAQLTGLPPHRSGVYGNEAQSDGYPLGSVPITFPEVLSDNGWRTLDFGKEHIPPQLQPWQHQDPDGSSMVDLVQAAQGCDVPVLRTPGIGHMISATLPEGASFPPTAITANVVRELMRADEQPFLIRASYLQPHTPVVVPEPWASKYGSLSFSTPDELGEGISEFERHFGAINEGLSMSSPDVDAARRSYYGSVAWLDDQVGELMESLERAGLTENTIVVFTADHGAYLGEDGAFGKHTFAPQSHRVPLIVRWPAHLHPSRRADLASSEDLARTVLSLCDVPVPEEMAGRSLFDDPAPGAIISSIGYGAPESRAFPNLDAGQWVDGRGWPQRFCVRTTRYRLDLNSRIDGHATDVEDYDLFLADALIDAGERVNRAADPAYRHVRERLTRLLMDARDTATQPDDRAVYSRFQPPAPRSLTSRTAQS